MECLGGKFHQHPPKERCSALMSLLQIPVKEDARALTDLISPKH